MMAVEYALLNYLLQNHNMRVYKEILGNMLIFPGSDQSINEPAHKTGKTPDPSLLTYTKYVNEDGDEDCILYWRPELHCTYLDGRIQL